MAEVAPFDWDYVIVNSPYTHPRRELEIRGVSFPPGQIPEDIWNESHAFLVFVKTNEAVKSAWVTRSIVDFGKRSTYYVIYRTNDMLTVVKDVDPGFSVLRVQKSD
jgi:hypothetical protein